MKDGHKGVQDRPERLVGARTDRSQPGDIAEQNVGAWKRTSVRIGAAQGRPWRLLGENLLVSS